MTLDEYINSLQRQRDAWLAEQKFQETCESSYSETLYLVASSNVLKLTAEIEILLRQRIL
jgi:hypothetical protein